MKWLTSGVLVTLGYLITSVSFAGDLAGVWKNDEEPAWMEIRFENDAGTGTVRRSDLRPKGVGRVILKDVVSDEKNPGSWRGEIYAVRLHQFMQAAISLPEPDRMQIELDLGFTSRTVSWSRVAAVPSE
jgi:hypothetical protein